MKKRLVCLVLGLVLVLGLAWGWFSRPMGLEQMFSGFSQERVDTISGSYVQFGVANGAAKTTTGVLDPAPLDEEGRELVEWLGAARFSRSLWGTVRERFSNSYSPSRNGPGDYAMILSLSGDGSVLSLDLYCDRLIITYYPQGDMALGMVRRVCSTKGHEELMNGCLAYLKAHETIR